jgi:nucleoside 2-deoxyribosyltransferase
MYTLPMRVYLAAAMTNATRNLDDIRALVELLHAQGHEVPTGHVADPSGREPEAEISDAELARRDLAWVASCDALVAEVSTPSHGVGIEVATALAHGCPVLLLHRAGARLSRLLLGLPGATTRAYASAADAAAAVSAFLATVATEVPASRRGS